MTTEVLFYTQIGSLVAIILTLFGIYRSLVSQKDAVISLLKEQLQAETKKVEELKSQTPDALSDALSKRIGIMTAEIERMRTDGVSQQFEIENKEAELRTVSERLLALNELVRDSDLICPDCSSPLVERGYETVYGRVGGREIDVDIEHRVYECGASFQDGHELCACPKKAQQGAAANP